MCCISFPAFFKLAAPTPLLLPVRFDCVEKGGNPGPGLRAAAASCVTARESPRLSDSPFSVREAGEDRVASRIWCSSLVSDGLTRQQPPPPSGRGLWLSS